MRVMFPRAMRPDLNFETLDEKPPQSIGLKRAFIFSGSIALMLAVVVALGAKFMNQESGEELAAVAPQKVTEATPALDPMEEPSPKLDDDLIFAASNAIIRPEEAEVDLEIRVEGDRTTSVEIPRVGSLSVDGEDPAPEGSFESFLELEAAALRTREGKEGASSSHADAVLRDIETQLSPLDPLQDDFAGEFDPDQRFKLPTPIEEKEDDVAVGLIFSKPEGEELTLNGKPIKLDAPSLPSIRSKSSSSSSSSADEESSKPFAGLFKGLGKKRDDEDSKKNIWNRDSD